MEYRRNIAGRIWHLEIEGAWIATLFERMHDFFPFDVSRIGRHMFIKASMIILDMGGAQTASLGLNYISIFVLNC